MWQRALMFLYCIAKVLWLCGYVVVVLIAAAYFFIGNDQGIDFLRILAEPSAPLLAYSLFFVSVGLWSGASWYTSRLLLRRRLPSFPLPEEGTKFCRRWIPRLLGGLAPLAVAAGFALQSPSRQAYWFAGLAIALFVFYTKRRQLFRITESADDQVDALPRVSIIVISTSIALSFVILLIFVASPVAAPRFFGTPAILILGTTALMLFGSIVLTFLPLRRGYPGITLLVLVYALAISGRTDNHIVREGSKEAEFKPGDRLSPQDHFDAWLKSVQPAPTTKRYPVFIVATAGGGIRAAYWTAIVLGKAADDVTPDAWRKHLYALSGVSGGSLGAAVHLAELATPQPNLQATGAKILSDDHLSPVTAYLLFPDLLQRFVPHPIEHFDRARALEASWVSSVKAQLPESVFEGPFLGLWDEGRRNAFPSLLLNSTVVETGQRAIVSNIDVREGFRDVVDLLAPDIGNNGEHPMRLLHLDRVQLAAAVHLSARFTYVSPAARIERDERGTPLWGRLVDGGYFENSGAATAAELIGATPQLTQACTSESCPIPVVLLIKNDPLAPSMVCSKARGHATPPAKAFSEIRSPIDALLAAREARGILAERQIVALVDGDKDPRTTNCEHGCVLEFSLAHTPTLESDAEKKEKLTDPPLGWSLSATSRNAMDSILNEHAAQFRCIKELVETGTCSAMPQCPN